VPLSLNRDFYILGMQKKLEIPKQLNNSGAIEYYVDSIEDMELVRTNFTKTNVLPEHMKDGNSEFWKEKRAHVFEVAMKIQSAYERMDNGEEVHKLELIIGLKSQ
jgi:hypothetical protein